MSEGTIQGYRLSPQQKHLWLLQQQTPGFVFWSQCAVRVTGQLDAERLEKAIRTVVEAHEILRTTFPLLPGMMVPVQVIHQQTPGCVRRHDFSSLDREEQDELIRKLYSASSDLPSDYDSLPLFHCELLQLSPAETLMLLRVPAICADLRSLEIIVGHIAGCYETGETTLELMQYADFAEWHHELLEGEEGQPGRQFWQAHSHALRTAVTLPFTAPITGETSFQPEVVRLKLGETAGEQLSRIALAAWQILIQRFTGSSGVTIGKAFDGRRHPELAGAVGLYTRYVPLPLEFVDERLRLAELLKRLDHVEREAAQWQEYFAWSEDLDKPAGYFSICFEERCGPDTFRAGDVTVSIDSCDATTDRFDLKLVSVLSDGTPRLELHYDTSRYAPDDVRRVAEELTTLIVDASRRPAAAIGDLESLSSKERLRIVTSFNQTTQNFPASCIHELFEAQAEKTPDDVAVVSGPNRATYAELNQRANQLARYLQKLGVGADVPVGLCLERSVDFVVGMLGILKAGGAYLPLDVNAPAARLATMLTDTRAPVLLTAQGRTSASPGCRLLFLDELHDELAKENSDNCVNNATPADLAYVIFTSGSTGKPKGVAVEHRQICNYFYAIDNRVGLSSCRQFAIVSSLVADLAHTMLFPSLLSGGTLHLIPEEHAANPELLADYFSRNPIECLKIVPAHLAALLTSPQSAGILPRRHLILGGEAVPQSLLERLAEVSGETTLWNHYGPTETTVGCAAQRIDPQDPRPRAITIGTPLANNTAYILDERLRPVSIGVAGELYIGGAGVARGYLNQPELTAERFVPNPFAEAGGARLYRTGDLARYLSDGRIEVLGRVDHQIKIRGYRIEPEEIQFALNGHPLISQSVVVARGDRPGDRRLICYLVAKQSPPPAIDELRNFLRERIPDYMVPSIFVFLAALPLTPNGKIDRQALPLPKAAASEKEVIRARNSIERELSHIWASVLGIREPGVNENFFELGGDSILAIQIVARANHGGMNLAPRQMFQHQTIAELAVVANETFRPEAEQGIVTGEIPLTPVQARFFELGLPDPHHYNQARLLKLREPVDSQSLQHAVAALLRQHDALRLRFFPAGQGWQQIAGEPESTTPFERLEVAHCNETEFADLLSLEAARLHTSLNLQDGPIIRLALFDGAGKTPSYLLIVVHHLAVDTVSWGVLIEDLETAYRQLTAGQEISLPVKTTSFKRWAEELTQFAQSARLAEEIEYWVSRTSQTTKLPVDRSGANSVASRRTVSASLTTTETGAVLHDLPAKYRTQINEVLLAALARTFTRWTASSSLLIDLEGHGREPLIEGTDLSRTVGWFTTISPVLLHLELTATPLEVLRAVKEQLRAIPNRGIGYGVLRYMSGKQDIIDTLSRSPQAEVRFNYLGQRDRVLASSKMFSVVEDAPGPSQSPSGDRGYLLNIISSVTNGELRFDWTYSENVHATSTIESLAETCLAELRAMLTGAETVGAAYTPSDFPKAKVSQSDLNTILAKLRS